MVTISGLYFLMIILLHSRLQVEICLSQTGNQKYQIRNNSFNHLALDHVQSLTRLQTELLTKAPCHLSSETTQFSFQTVAENLFYVYTAYLDKRMNSTYVRIMSILLRGKKDNINVICSFKGDNLRKVTAIKYEMCENHNKKFGGWIMSCPIPENIPDPCEVTVSSTLNTEASIKANNVTLNIIPLDSQNTKVQYSVCIPPLFGSVNSSRLIEFLEFTKYLGAEKFIFYTHGIQDEKSQIALEHYSNESLVTVIPWKLPDMIQDGQIWYHGQLIAHNDCLYRSMSLTDKLAIQDMDELIVPHDSTVFWDQSLTPLLSGNVKGLGIHSAFFDTTLRGDVLAISSIKRTKNFSRFRTKVLVKPSAIFEVGIHHVSKPLLEQYKIISPPTSKVLLHHYRSCLSNYGMNCKDWVLDQTIKVKYGHVRNHILHVKSIVDALSHIDKLFCFNTTRSN